MTVVERASRYVGKLEGAVSGAGGHNATLHVACVLVKGFALSAEEALGVMREWNGRCSPPWSERELAHKVKSAEGLPDDRPRGYLLGGRPVVREEGRGVVRAPVVEPVRRYAYDIEALRRGQGAVRVTRTWLAERSPVDVRGVTSGEFLEAVLERGERALVFANERSQGEWGYVAGAGWVRLAGDFGPERAPAERVAFPVSGRRCGEGPATGKLGVWWLNQPVDGRWHPTPDGGWSRRSWMGVTCWRHMVLESDEAPEDLYLGWLVQQKLPVVALYTSAGKSIHVVLRFDGVRSKAQWDAIKDAVMPYLSKVGVDWKTLTAVRLTRLPGCLREGKMVREVGPDGGKVERYERFPRPRLQELLYLNPRPEVVRLADLPQQRSFLRVGEDGADDLTATNNQLTN